MQPYWQSEGVVLYKGDATDILPLLPAKSAHCCVTSPPYWQARNYKACGQLGHERTPEEYVDRLVEILNHLRRVLVPDGSLWLNIGDVYRDKNLLGLPWRVAFALQSCGWILRNEVIWYKKKHVPSNANDRLAGSHEHVFHFVLQRNHYYDLDAIRELPLVPSNKNGHVTTPTGVNGKKYRRQILHSSDLTEDQRQWALAALEMALEKVRTGEWPDFRMLIKGIQRVVHSDDGNLSGRAKEVEEKGFALLNYHSNGSAPIDVWEIQPEDEVFLDSHFAQYPEELCVRPILATCPVGGVVIDPFVGSGTTLMVAIRNRRKAIGIDLYEPYLAFDRKRVESVVSKSASHQPALF